MSKVKVKEGDILENRAKQVMKTLSGLTHSQAVEVLQNCQQGLKEVIIKYP